MDNFNNITIDSLSYGWVCPKCGRVFSPTTIQCPYCSGNDYSTTNNHTQIVFTPSTTTATTFGDFNYNTTAPIKCANECDHDYELYGQVPMDGGHTICSQYRCKRCGKTKSYVKRRDI